MKVDIDIKKLLRKSLFDTFDQISYPEDLDQSLDIRKTKQQYLSEDFNFSLLFTPLLFYLFGAANGEIIMFNIEYLGLKH